MSVEHLQASGLLLPQPAHPQQARHGLRPPIGARGLGLLEPAGSG